MFHINLPARKAGFYMFKKIKLCLVIVTVIAIIFSAGWLLWQQNDPHLEEIEFIQAYNLPNENVTKINQADQAINTTEADLVESVFQNDEINKEVKSEQEKVTSTSFKTEQPETKTNTPATTTTNLEQAKPVVNINILGPKLSKTCSVMIEKKATVHRVMQQASSQCNFSYTGKKYSNLGFFVEEIAGLKQNQTSGKYWIYLINGQKAQLGVSAQTVAPGDAIQWNYENKY